MRALRPIGHIGIVVLSLFLLAGVPILTHFDIAASGQAADAVSSASLDLPDQPSGDFIVLLNTAKHAQTLPEWQSFFRNEAFPVIFEDIQCLVAEGDAGGQQLAERFQAQLPENQMTLRTENPTLLISKAEAGYIDAAVFSREMAEALRLSPDTARVTVIEIAGGAD